MDDLDDNIDDLDDYYMAPGVNEAIAEFEQKTGRPMKDWDKVIFQFGHAYGRRDERRELKDLKIIE